VGLVSTLSMSDPRSSQQWTGTPAARGCSVPRTLLTRAWVRHAQTYSPTHEPPVGERIYLHPERHDHLRYVRYAAERDILQCASVLHLLRGPGAGGDLYQIDALGYGGTPNAVAVVESTFVIKTSGVAPTRL